MRRLNVFGAIGFGCLLCGGLYAAIAGADAQEAAGARAIEAVADRHKNEGFIVNEGSISRPANAKERALAKQDIANAMVDIDEALSQRVFSDKTENDLKNARREIEHELSRR